LPWSAQFFVAGEYWIFSTLQKSFEKNSLAEMTSLVKAMVASAPKDDEALAAWAEQLAGTYSDSRFFVIQGVPG